MKLQHPVRDYQAVAVVTSAELLTDLEVGYVHPHTDTRVRVTMRFDGLSDTKVDRPGWFAEARNATDVDLLGVKPRGIRLVPPVNYRDYRR